MNNGIIVGCDSSQEWLLPWWWDNYTCCNSLPVAFFDFGMSASALNWCSKRGEIFPLQALPVHADPSIALSNTQIYGNSAEAVRKEWFKKPLAMLQSPYQKTLWLDLDCEVLGSLLPLFEATFALAREPESCRQLHFDNGMLLENEVLYNSGVVLFDRSSPLVRQWAEETLSSQHLYFGDQHIISRLIHLGGHTIQELPEEYNWRMSKGLNINAIIVHWVGTWGKEYIRKFGGIRHQINNI